MYANTGKDADTAVKPIDKGLETFTNIRSDAAPEHYSWTVDLPGDQRLEKTESGEVVVVDPTPKASDDPLPPTVDADAPKASEIAKAEGIQTDASNDRPLLPADDAVEDSGVDRPSQGAVTPLDPRSLEQPAAAEAQKTAGEAAPVAGSAPSTAEVDDQTAKVEQIAEGLAKGELGAAEASGDQHADEVNADNAKAADTQPVVVATISAPQSIDADGKTVPTSLEISGDAVTLEVDHRSESVSYPIAADPIITIPVLAYRLSYYPVYRQETYISSWAEGAVYVGNWHPVYCQMGIACSAIGGGWYGNNYAGNRYLSYWPAWNWGPTYQLYYYPLYATRMVLDHWQPYWEPYIATVAVFSDPDASNAWNTGFDVYQEPGDYDPGDGPDFSLVASSAAGRSQSFPGEGRMRGCTTVRGNGTIDVPFAPDVAHPTLTSRFCWSKYKRKTSYTPLSMRFDPRVSRTYEITSGADITVRDPFIDYFTWNGSGSQGRVFMGRDFDLTMSPTGGLKIGKYTYQRYRYTIRGYWNGDYEGALQIRK